MEVGMRNSECGSWKAEGGSRKVEGGKWNAESGMRNSECGIRNAEVGRRKVECGSWNAEVGMRFLLESRCFSSGATAKNLFVGTKSGGLIDKRDPRTSNIERPTSNFE